MKIVIVGGNHAGIAAARRIREDYPEDEVYIFEKSHEVGFVSQTIPLFLMGQQKLDTQGNYTNPDEIRKLGINLYIETEVTSVDVKEKLVKYKNEEKKEYGEIVYDKLIMASGSYPSLPPTGGKVGESLFLIKDKHDALVLDHFVQHAKHVAVIGAGLVGVEVSRILAKRGLQVTLIHARKRILNDYLDDVMSIETEKQLEKEGIRVLLNMRARNYETVEKKLIRRPRVKISLGIDDDITVDGVIVSTGFRPNSYLLAGQVETGDKGAILVDKYMHSSNPDILAVGDCATTYMDLIDRNVYNPHASDAFRQGAVAGINIHEKKQPIGLTTGTYRFNMEDFFIAKTGLTLFEAMEQGWDADFVNYRNEVINSDDFASGCLVYERKTHKVLGIQVLGTRDISYYVNTFSYAIQTDAVIEDLEFSDFYFEHGYKDPMSFASKVLHLIREKEKEALANQEEDNS
ncbi:MAG: FAD-dependent oxidoreductase [Streptococcaceae bacterium]|jgi:NADPH-dependent 2,4-dienoyl-CoA reductase/sulfur reductase-like enzyme|nr:FAD-dependent oxidoreductase [Streptococcaceae bacterium]